jgi:hypothetical protein
MMTPYYGPCSVGPGRSLNPRQDTVHREEMVIIRTINSTIDIYVEGRGSRLPRLAVHHLRLVESTSFVDAGVRHLSRNRE